MDLIIGFFAFIIGLFVGFQLATNMAGRVLGGMLHEFGITDQQIVKKAEEMGIDVSKYVDEDETLEAESVVEVMVERIEDRYYAYHWENDAFITHAGSPQELFEQLVEYFPTGTRVNIDIDRGAEYFKDIAEKG